MPRSSAFLAIAVILVLTSVFYTGDLNKTAEKDVGAFAGDILTSGKKLYSQNDEELIIRDFFNDRRGGVFMDVGCYHYKDLSTTYYLEKHLGWSGIAVDALAEFALGYVLNRPNTRFFNFIVTDYSGNIEPFYRVNEVPALSSAEKRRVEKVLKRKEVETYRVIYVPTITLTELLEKNGISEIDFLSMDIEEGELAALAGFDIKRFKPELVCIEPQPSIVAEILDYFTRYDYERIEKYRKYDWNWYFKPKD